MRQIFSGLAVVVVALVIVPFLPDPHLPSGFATSEVNPLTKCTGRECRGPLDFAKLFRVGAHFML